MMHTPYDSVFRTLLNDAPRLVIPLVNLVFGTQYGEGEPVHVFNNEFFVTTPEEGRKEKVTDSCFEIQGRLFHFECQSTMDPDLSIRVFEYDAALAIREMKRGQLSEVSFPSSAVLHLRSRSTTPDELTLTVRFQEDICTRRVPVIKVPQLTREELFSKTLYFLIPFHIFRYEKILPFCEENAAALSHLLAQFRDLFHQLEDSCLEGRISNREGRLLLEMTDIVIQNLTHNYTNVRKEFEKLMGGEILEYPSKTIYNQGWAEGKTKAEAMIFRNMIDRGYAIEEARALTGLTDEQVYRALAEKEQ